MKIKSLESALKKAGYEIKEDKFWKNNTQYFVKSSSHVLSWYTQGDEVSSLHIRRHDDHSDIMTDYFAGWFPKTIKSALSGLTW